MSASDRFDDTIRISFQKVCCCSTLSSCSLTLLRSSWVTWNKPLQPVFGTSFPRRSFLRQIFPIPDTPVLGPRCHRELAPVSYWYISHAKNGSLSLLVQLSDHLLHHPHLRHYHVARVEPSPIRLGRVRTLNASTIPLGDFREIRSDLGARSLS